MSLVEAARAAREHAYAPYSQFKVGAAIRAASGRIFVGCNVENVSYPEGLCAEASAVAAMVSGGETRIAAIAVIADAPTPVPPCGGCRQKLVEFADGTTPVMMARLDGTVEETTLGALLPGAFATEHLE